MGLLFSESSLEVYKSIMQYNPDAIFVLSVEGTILEVNEVACKIFGYSQEEIQGLHYQDVLAPGYEAFVKEKLTQVLNGMSCEYNIQAIRKNGQIVHLQVKNIPLVVNGEVIGILGVAKDVTELRKTRASLTQMEAGVRALFYSIGDAIDILDLDGNVVDINPAFEEMYGWKREEILGKPLPIIPSFREKQQREMMERAKMGEHIQGFETVCLKKDGTPIMVSLTLSPLQDESGNIIGTCSITREITGQKQVEQSLRESEDRYRKVVELSPKGILIHRNGTILYANPFAMKTLRTERLIGKNIFSYIHPDYHERSRQRFLDLHVGKELPFIETIMVRDDGKMIDVEIGGVHIIQDGEPVVLSIFQDVTERKKAERALAESEKRYRKLVELSPIAVIVHRDGLIQYANPACTKLLGASSIDDLLRKSILDFSPPEYRHLAESHIQELNRTGIAIDPTEEKIRRMDGKTIDVKVTGISIQYDGKPSYLMILQDITREKQAEEALRQSEARYRLIAENMSDLVGILDVNGVVKYASPSHKSVLGFDPEVYEGNPVFDMVHPNDVFNVRKEFSEIAMTKEEKIIEFRYKHVQGHWVWVEAKGTPVLDEAGNLVHFQVVARDITERKRYEEKLAHLAFHDALTGLPNRRLFRDRFKQAIKEAERYGRKMAVMYIDMDRFKVVNDSMGHDVGDELLKQFAERVSGCLRASDILARLGGDEFTILLPEIHEEQDAVRVAQRILTAIQQPWEIGEQVFRTTSSIGIAFYPMHGTTRHELLQHADEALYSAKESGKNTVRTYSELLGATTQER
ncbi:MAG: PAS domain S-box protein [Alicyclobacillus herbarius]|uniref:sensor domain-containing diguanylate cyclase n=1 Tax=Alicyclobacillus herbarius TaxID=122960 RepID=UPI002352D995|nr:sensor domain-containing diguanylate cyclase [Alicyclobacillus herbarius]MCL6632074.1 PAS domain S-box protein [Alicyclobacillus herbarius]